MDISEIEKRQTPYVADFTPSQSNNARGDKEYDEMFLKAQQTWLNHRLQSIGHMFLNEVYDALGFKRTPEGAVVGWLSSSYIDFGLDSEARKERPDLVIFDVDGVIWDKI